jgi:formylglycine-generating enzyme required for sulfatase activity
MASIPAGNYVPFFKATATSRTIAVRAFLLDAVPVSRDQYLDFVLHSDAWSKSRVPALFAEPTYLADWPSDQDSGPTAGNLPITYVSWFAARAYCAFRGNRLPTLAEWEMASATPSGRRLLHLPENGGAADATAQETLDEWILDFNSTLVSGRSIDQPSDLFCGAGARANDASDYAAFSRYAFRSSLRASFALRRLSFRCARDAP